MVDRDYGLELTNNSKVGWAFSLPRSKTCINATTLCKRLCYGNGIRYQSKGQKDKRERNFRTVQFLLEEGGSLLLAENLGLMVDQARPRDWLTAKITATKTAIPWTLRIHDIGDFHCVDYVEAWILTATKFSECKFWFYTRSFSDPLLFDGLSRLASLPNCQGWLSVDSENFEQAILAKCSAPASVWNLALLQDKELAPDVIPSLLSLDEPVNIVNFPYHRAGHHLEPVRNSAITQCPAIVGGLTLKTSKEVSRPCQICSFCLP